MTTIASAAPATTTRSSTQSTLVQLADGEYSAASVSKDPTDAAKLGLVREKDGNYGTQATTSASGASSSSVQAALLTLTLGGS